MADAIHGANVPAMQRTVLDLIHEYEDKAAYIPQAIADFEAAFDRLGMAATAHYDHGELKGEWRDLPVGSFADAGTNVPTGLLKMRKAA